MFVNGYKATAPSLEKPSKLIPINRMKYFCSDLDPLLLFAQYPFFSNHCIHPFLISGHNKAKPTGGGYQMKRNVGTYDAILRITFGLTGLAYSIVIANGRKNRFPLFMALFSSLKIAEGVLRYCPMLNMFDKNTLKDCLLSNKQNHSIELQPEHETN